MFAIIVIGITIALLFVKPYESKMSLFHAFCPMIVGWWLGDLVGKFYNWLKK